MSWLHPFNRPNRSQEARGSANLASISEVKPDSLRIVSPLLNEISQFWFAIREGSALPDWHHFSPHTHTKFLPHIILWEVADGSYFARVAGEQVSNMLPNKVANRRLDDIECEALAPVSVELDQAVSTGAPVYVDRPNAWVLGDENVHCQAVHSPFRSHHDDTIRLLSVISFTTEPRIDV